MERVLIAHVGVVALGRKPRAGIVQRQPSAGATCVRSVPTTFAVNETPSWLGPGLRPAVESGSAQAGISSLEVSHLSGADGDESCFYAVARSSGPQDRRHVHLDGAGSEVQRCRDLHVRLSVAEPDQDLSLASREALEAFDGARVLGVRRRDAGVEQT